MDWLSAFGERCGWLLFLPSALNYNDKSNPAFSDYYTCSLVAPVYLLERLFKTTLILLEHRRGVGGFEEVI